jgi:hypothetical protein
MRIARLPLSLAGTLVLAACSASRPVAGPPLTTCDPLELTDQQGAPIVLTGEWTANDQGRYHLRQDGSCLTWVGLSGFEDEELGASWVTTLRGRIEPDRTINGEFLDVGGAAHGSGTLRLRIEDDDAAYGGLVLVTVEATGHPYGGSFWERVRPLDEVPLEPDESPLPGESPLPDESLLPDESPAGSEEPAGSDETDPVGSGASTRPSDEPPDSPSEGPPQTDG